MKHYLSTIFSAGTGLLHFCCFIIGVLGLSTPTCEGFSTASSAVLLAFARSSSTEANTTFRQRWGTIQHESIRSTSAVKLTASSIDFDLVSSGVQLASNLITTPQVTTTTTSLVDPADFVLLGGLMFNPGLLLAPIGAAVVAAGALTFIFLSNLDPPASDDTADPDDQYYIDEDDPVLITRKEKNSD